MIDFSKAPADATHYAVIREGHNAYYKVECGVVFYWERYRWLASPAPTLESIPIGPTPIPESK